MLLGGIASLRSLAAFRRVRAERIFYRRHRVLDLALCWPRQQLGHLGHRCAAVHVFVHVFCSGRRGLTLGLQFMRGEDVRRCLTLHSSGTAAKRRPLNSNVIRSRKSRVYYIG